MIKKKNSIISLIISLVLVSVISFLSYRLWELKWDVPFAYDGDSALGLVMNQSFLENGPIGYYFSDRLGAPEMSSLIDTPFLDMCSVIEMTVLSIFVKSPAGLNHAMFFMSFPLICIAMYILLTKLTDSLFLRSVFSIVFTIAPYHFLRGENHLYLANYYIVPIVIYLAFILLEEKYLGIFPETISNSKLKKVLYVLMCLVIGMNVTYYVFFGLIVLIVSLIVKLLKEHNWKIIIHEGISIIIIGIGAIITLLPKLLYTVASGPNSVAAAREPYETEQYALKLIQLLLPPGNSNIPFLRAINEKYSFNGIYVTENASASLGLLAGIGFVFVCIWIILSFCKAKINIKSAKDNQISRINFIALEILTLFVVGIAGGIGTIFAYFVSASIRAVCRISIFIAGFSICAIVIVIDYLFSVLSKKEKNITYGLVIILFAFSVIVEVPFSSSDMQQSAINQDKYMKDFWSCVDATVEEGDLVYTLPFTEFPEGGIYNYLVCYETGYGYVYSDKVKLSFGGVNGRNDVARQLYIDKGKSYAFVKLLKEFNFSGIYIDTWGYDDFGKSITNFYTNELGITPIVSENERWYYYNISDYVVDDSKAVIGYAFIDDFYNLINIEISEDKKRELALDVYMHDYNAYKYIFDSAIDSGYFSENSASNIFINVLIETLLDRRPTDKELEYFNANLNNITRFEMFALYIDLEDFRKIYGME